MAANAATGKQNARKRETPWPTSESCEWNCFVRLVSQAAEPSTGVAFRQQLGTSCLTLHCIALLEKLSCTEIPELKKKMAPEGMMWVR